MFKRKRRSIPSELRQKVFEVKGTICFCCGIDVLLIPKRDRTVDHIKQVFLGGRNNIENLRAACRRCNITRHNMTDEELKEYIENKHDPAYIYRRQKENARFWREQKKLRSEAARKGWRNRRKKLLG
jgi:5-methylcytosine-specific restriction endonuclease McrA